MSAKTEDAKIAGIFARVKSGEKKLAIIKDLGMSSATFYKILRQNTYCERCDMVHEIPECRDQQECLKEFAAKPLPPLKPHVLDTRKNPDPGVDNIIDPYGEWSS